MNKTLLFHWGLEGGGSEVHRITEKGKERIVQSYSYMDFDESDDEIWRQGEIEHASFAEFWQEEALKNNKWYRWYPVFIHDDCKTIVRKSLEEIDVIGLMENERQAIGRWKMML